MSKQDRLLQLRDESFRALRGEDVANRPRQRVRQMDKMPPRLRNTNEFREAYVINAAMGKCRPAAANRHMSLLRDAHFQAGTLDEYTRFEKMLEDTLGRMNFGLHGFHERLLEDADPQKVFDGIHRIVAVLKEMGHDCFVNSGTLLGLVRDGKLIPYDYDIDIAVLLKATRDRAAAAEFRALEARLQAAGIDCAMTDSGNPIIKLPDIDGISVDLFPAYGSYSRYNVFPYAHRDLRFRDIFPLQSCAATGLPLPADPETVLACNYGPDWRIPNARFTFPWDAQKAKFSILLEEIQT